MINDIREWHTEFPDWHDTRDQIVSNYGYDKYSGNCHIVPNHALIIMSLLHGADDFDKSLMMVNTSGWDTDCNSGNVGCLLGIKNGLASINLRWRDPVADRLYLPTAEGGSAISDAVIQTYNVVNIGRALAGQAALHPKDNARFHFEQPGSVQGFQSKSEALRLENVSGHSQAGTRSLAFHFTGLQPNRLVEANTPTFIPTEAINMSGYMLLACPTLYPGQTVEAALTADSQNQAPLNTRLVVHYYAANDQLVRAESDTTTLNVGQSAKLEWTLPDFNGAPIAQIGLELSTDQPNSGSIYLDYLKWTGEPKLVLKKASRESILQQRAWVDSTDNPDLYYPEFRLVQNYGTGLLMQGTRDWKNIEVSADVTPHMVKSAGVAVRVQGLERYYALVMRNDATVALIKLLDGEHVLASKSYDWSFGTTYQLRLRAHGSHISGWVNNVQVVGVEDADLADGAIALLCTEGRTSTETVTVQPA